MKVASGDKVFAFKTYFHEIFGLSKVNVVKTKCLKPNS